VSEALIACCGLDCSECDMRKAAKDPEMQRDFARWFKEKLGKDVDPADIGCTWCRGDREGHWSPDCWILECCVGTHGRENCSTCPEFPCDRLRDWAAQNERYTAALERLRRLRQEFFTA